MFEFAPTPNPMPPRSPASRGMFPIKGDGIQLSAILEHSPLSRILGMLAIKMARAAGGWGF